MKHARGNYPMLIYGNYRNNAKLVRITKYLKENGYITSYSSDYFRRDNTRTLHNLTIDEVDDHQMFLCDQNKGDFNKNTIKCLYGKIHNGYISEGMYCSLLELEFGVDKKLYNGDNIEM